MQKFEYLENEKSFLNETSPAAVDPRHLKVAVAD